MGAQNYLIALVLALLVFVLGLSVVFSITKSERCAIGGGVIIFVLACLLLKVNGWL